MPKNYETEPREIDEFAVLDMDRTLIDSSMVTKLVLAGMVEAGVSAEQVTKILEYVEAQKGNSFYLFQYISQKFSPELLASAVDWIMNDDQLLDEIRDDLLCHGADRLIEALEVRDIPYTILTFGEPSYQNFKIELFKKLVDKTSDDFPALVTDVGNKSDWISKAWLDDVDSPGVIPAEITGEALRPERVIVIDDKSHNLESGDDRMRGILIDNAASNVPGSMPIATVADALADGVTLTDIAEVYSGAHSRRN